MFSKPAVEDYRELDVFSLNRCGVLKPGYSCNWNWCDPETGEVRSRVGFLCEGNSIRLNYQVRQYGGEWEEIEDHIPLGKSYPNYGGERFWFICPSCNRRRAKLYLVRVFRCRGCRGACHKSQLETPSDRALRRLYKLRQRYGGFGGCGDPFPEKPKRMRWATYKRLLVQDMDNMDLVNVNMIGSLTRLSLKLSGR